MWEKFNKSADRFFTAKKEVIESEITKVNELLAQLKDGQISTNEANDEIQALKNINKSKELDQLKKEIISIKQKKIKEQQILKITSYINILESYLSDDIEKSDIPASIKNKLNTDSPTKSDLNNLVLGLYLKLFHQIETLLNI